MKIILDFDGTLVDSYHCIPEIYKEIEEKYGFKEGFSEAMLMVEDLGDFFGIFERRDWIIILAKDVAEEILRYYWDERMKRQKVLEDVKAFLENINAELYLVTSKDDDKETKYKRIKATGLEKYFKDIIIYGEDFKDLLEAIEYVIDEKDNCVYIDDKNINIFKVVSRFKEVKAYKRKFYPPFPKKLAWNYPKINVEEIDDLRKLLNVIKNY